MAVEEAQQQQQKRARDADVGLLTCPDENRFAGVPCEVVALMLATEIRTGPARMYPERELSLIFSLMQTDTNLLRCILSDEGEPIWRELIAKYFSDFRFVALDRLELDFFTVLYLGDSPLNEIRHAVENEYAGGGGGDDEMLVVYMREQLRQQLQLHKRRGIFAAEKAIVASDAYALFMYMLLWYQRIETKTMMTPVVTTGDLRGFYKTVTIEAAVLKPDHKYFEVIRVDVFQHYPDTELMLVCYGYTKKEIRVATGIIVTSLVHCAYYTDSYTNVNLCLILNGSHLLQVRFSHDEPGEVVHYYGPSTVAHTYYGDVTAVCPQIRHCRSLTEATRTMGRRKGRVTSLKNDNYAYVRAMCASMEPVVRRQATVTGSGGGGGVRESLNSIELIDFRQLTAQLDGGGDTGGGGGGRKKPIVLTLAANSFRGHVLGSCILEVVTASHPFLYVCYYSEGKLSVAVAPFVAPTKIGTFSTITLQQYDTPEDALHFLAYDYRRFSVFGSTGMPLRHDLDRLTVRVVTPRGTLRKYLLRLNATSGQPTGFHAEGAGILPVGAYSITVLPVTGHVRVIVRCQTGMRRECGADGKYGVWGTFTFLASADFLRTTYPVEVPGSAWNEKDRIVALRVAPLMGLAAEAFTEKSDALGGGDYVVRPGIRVLISSADAESPMLAYSTEPRRREELGFLGVPYCAYCGDVTPLEGLGVDEVDTGRVFCLEAACQHDF
jgi:hypothetical protein